MCPRVEPQLNHPHVVNLYAFYADESYYYLVMEMLRGGELLSVIADKDRIVSTFSEEDARRILYQLCLGLQCVADSDACDWWVANV